MFFKNEFSTTQKLLSCFSPERENTNYLSIKNMVDHFKTTNKKIRYPGLIVFRHL